MALRRSRRDFVNEEVAGPQPWTGIFDQPFQCLTSNVLVMPFRVVFFEMHKFLPILVTVISVADH